jgi:hypothetical protein
MDVGRTQERSEQSAIRSEQSAIRSEHHSQRTVRQRNEQSVNPRAANSPPVGRHPGGRDNPSIRAVLPSASTAYNPPSPQHILHKKRRSQRRASDHSNRL